MFTRIGLITTFACSVSCFSFSGVNAADIVHEQPVEPIHVTPSFSWSGAYVGGVIGWSWADGRYKRTSSDVSGAISNKTSHTQKRTDQTFLGGVYLGYNFDLGQNIILGAEAEGVWFKHNDKKTTITDSRIAPYDVKRSYHSVKHDWTATARLRLGYAMGRFLPYIAAGATWSEADYNLKTTYTRLSNGATRSVKHSGTQDIVGWNIAAGVDYALLDNLLLRAEYRYTDFVGKNLKLNRNDKLKIGYEIHGIRFGLAYKF